MKTALYWIIPAVIYFWINVNSCAQDNSPATPGKKTIKLHGKVDIVFTACSTAGINLTANALPAVIEKVRLGSPAFYAGITAGDKILSARLDDNKLSLLIERKGQKFSVQLATVPINQYMDSKSADIGENKNVAGTKETLAGEAVYNRLADVLIKHYSQPNDKELKAELDSLQKQTKIQVENNGGQWHIAAYYSAKIKDPRYLLCEGVRFYAIGDLKDAQRLFEEVTRLYPENADAYFNIGALCESKSEFALAANYYKKALKCKPFDLEIQKAANTVGPVPMIFQGGAFQLATSMKALKATGLQVTDTCDLCQILRNGAMHGG